MTVRSHKANSLKLLLLVLVLVPVLLLLTTYYLLLAIYYLLLTTYYLLLTTHYSLLTTHYSLPSTTTTKTTNSPGLRPSGVLDNQFVVGCWLFPPLFFSPREPRDLGSASLFVPRRWESPLGMTFLPIFGVIDFQLIL